MQPDASKRWRTADDTIITRIESVAAERADALAVHAGASSLTYGELNSLANRIAHSILAAGARSEPVALLLGQGTAVVAASLAAGKAGLAWVQLHPQHPDDRNAFVLADTGARYVVTDRAEAHHAHRLVAHAGTSATVVVLEETATAAAWNPNVAFAGEMPLIIKYTSGSTGSPKGVCLPADAVLAAAREQMADVTIRESDRIASLTPILSTIFHYGPLLHGAAAFLYDVQRKGVEPLANWLDREHITAFSTVPTVFRRLLHSIAPDRVFSNVRVTRLYGEAVTRAEYDGWRAHFPRGGLLRVGLGSTEALGFAAASFTHDTPVTDAVLPLRYLSNERTVRLVDEHGNDVAPGEVGEIEVRSAIMFSGYWRRPDATAAVLRVDPESPAQRIFRTGDLGRRLLDGRFFHAGRADRQVKVAGNRIELAEIEHALRRIPGVRDAAVVPRTRERGIVRLVACCVPAGDAPNRPDVRRRLAAWLPPHMIPSAFVFVDALPTLAIGKVDYATLAERIGEGPAYVPPRHPIEETLVASWQRILGVDPVGIHDDFFHDLGGDSLAAVQVLADVSALFGRDLPLAVFHEATTIATLATRLLDDGWRPPADGRLALNAGGRRPPLFAICGAYGHALRLLLIGRGLDPDQPFVGLQPPEMNWGSAGCRTIEAMAAHYAAAIRRMYPDGPYRLLGTSLGGLVAFEAAIVLQAQGHDVDLLAMVDTAFPASRGAEGVAPVARRDFVDGDPQVPLIADGLRVARQHVEALRDYLLEHRFAGEILYFRCDVSPDPTIASRRGLWGGYATRGLRVVPVPGAHGGFHQDPQRSAIVAGLRASLRPTASSVAIKASRRSSR